MTYVFALEAPTLARPKRDYRDPEATDDDIPGPYKDAARFVRGLVGASGSVRGLTFKTNINFRTIDAMIKGGRADVSSVIQLCRVYGVNPNRLISLYGYETIPEFEQIDWSGSATTKPFSVRERPDQDPEPDERLLARILLEFEMIGSDGTRRPVRADDLTPGMRRELADLLLSGQLQEPGPD